MKIEEHRKQKKELEAERSRLDRMLEDHADTFHYELCFCELCLEARAWIERFFLNAGRKNKKKKWSS